MLELLLLLLLLALGFGSVREMLRGFALYCFPFF
jgi:hypothetical protein